MTFSELPRTGLATPAEFAAFIKRPTQTLAAWRSRGQGPRYLKLLENGHVRYRWVDISSWLESQLADGVA